MKLIKQSFEILEQKDFTLKGIKQFIERCGRVCYKSEDRITDTSYEKFVSMLESKGHDRPLEFGTVHLQMHISDFHKLRDTLCINELWNDQWIKHHYIRDLTYVTTNYRYYLTIIKVCPNIEEYFDPQDDELYPKRYTVHMILSRGVMDEFRTHVGLSHLAESTRYCNYNKDKFDSQLTFIQPNWMNFTEQGVAICSDEESPESIFTDSLENAEDTYLSLIKGGWKPQQAREVLPLSVKSELISCGFADAWANFFSRRCALDAHPMAREIALKIQDEFIRLHYIGYVNK